MLREGGSEEEVMFLVGIAGGSGSGKTSFARKIKDRIKNGDLAILKQDSYYQSIPPEHIKVKGEPNFDHPDAFDWPLLTQHLSLLKNGKSVQVPVYEYKENKRSGETIEVGPSKAILLEGIFTLWDEEIRRLMDLRIFLNVDADIRFIRRLNRDVQERGRNLDSVVRQYYETVRPMYQKFLEPTRRFADLSVGEETDRAATVVAARISEKLSQL